VTSVKYWGPSDMDPSMHADQSAGQLTAQVCSEVMLKAMWNVTKRSGLLGLPAAAGLQLYVPYCPGAAH
jgi:hypothetical protein